MLWIFLFKSVCQRYNILDMDEDVKMQEQNFSGMEFQIFPTDYHTWGFPVFVLESPLQVRPSGIPKW